MAHILITLNFKIKNKRELYIYLTIMKLLVHSKHKQQ